MTTEHNRAVTTPTVGLSERVDRVASWVGWHLGELTGVGVPVVLAITVNGWWVVPAVVVAAGWLTHEVRHARRTQPRRTRLALPPAPHDQDSRGVPSESA